MGAIAGGVVDEFGLSTLGWAPSLDPEATYIAPFEGSGDYDAVQYAREWDNGFGLKASYAKIGTAWETGAARGDGERTGEHDYDRFQIEGAYKWEGGGLALNVMYERDATGDVNDAQIYDDAGAVIGIGSYEDRWEKTTAWYLNPAIMHSWGAFSVHAEAKFGFGKHQFYNDRSFDGLPGYEHLKDADADGQGVYLDLDYNYGPGRVNLAGWWVSGNDIDDRDDNSVVDIVDGNFYPLVAAYGYVGYNTSPSWDERVGETYGIVNVANDGGYFTSRSTVVKTDAASVAWDGVNMNQDGLEPGDAGYSAALAALTDAPAFIDRTRFSNGSANHWALMLSGQHALTEAVSLNYALAYLSLTNPNYRVMQGLDLTGATVSGVRYRTQDKELGWEADLGVSVQLLDNLAFTSTFGYLFAGDAYQSLKGYEATTAGGVTTFDAQWEDADDSYSWVNTLVFSF